MTTPAAQMVQLSCPNCRTPLRAPVVTLIDVMQQPELKSYLLAGQLNTVVCTNCGTPSMIAAPLIYHDAAKQLFFVHFPQQMNARPEDQERFIGEATSILMRTMPADAPKGYLLSPRRFLTLNSLVESVLEGDGITKEMIEAQRQRVDLISQFAEAFDQGGEEAMRPLVDANRDALDQDFFNTLTAFAQASAQQRREEAQLLLDVRTALMQMVGFESDDDLLFEEDEVDLDAAVDRLINASDEELEQVVSELRPVIDYGFMDIIAARIDEADAAGHTVMAEQLSARRDQIVALVEQLDREAQELFDAGARVLREALEGDAEAVLRDNQEQISEAFLLVLDANIQEAMRANRPDVAERLAEIRELAIQIAEESLTPEERLINQLLSAPEAADATKLLRQNTDMISTDFVKRLNELASEAETNGRTEVGERLRQLARESAAMLF